MDMHTAGRSFVLALLAAAGTALAAGDAAQLGVRASKGSSVLTYGGRALHTAQGVVSSPRIIPVRDRSTVIATWNQRDHSGVQAYYGLSLDGGRSFAVVEPTSYLVRLVYAAFDPLAGEPVVAPELKADGSSHVYLVQFAIPPVDEFRTDLAMAGARVERFMTDHTHVVTMDAAAANVVAKFPHVRWVGRYHPAYRLSAEIRAELASGVEAGAQRYSIECFQRGPVQQQAVGDAVRAMGGLVEMTSSDGFRMEATLTKAQLLAVAAMDEVNYIDHWGGPGGTDMHIVRQLQGATNAQNQPIGGFSGQGVRGEVFDTEVRVSHSAFQSPAVLLHGNSAGVAGNAHGSACYGINFADWPTNTNYNGLCTSAEQGIFFYYANCSQFTGGPTRLTLNTEATNPNGVYKSCYQTSSVGSAQITSYTTVSAEVDDYLFKVDYLSCQSQSNTGNTNSRPQAWAKNIVSVGGLFWQGTVSRNDDSYTGAGTPASFGPAADGRVKPDLTNCYSGIPSTWNSSNTGTTDFGGTSGATPITAGCFGLLMQMWHEGVFAGFGGGSSVFSDRPRSMTAKAMMINTAFRYPLTQGGLTRAKQGWGMSDVANLYNLRNKVKIVNESDLLTNGQTKTYQVSILSGEPVANFTMSYIDPQGSPAAQQARINDLSLRVTSPTGQVYRGNAGLNASNFSAPSATANTIDTVENVFVQNPAAGQWTVEVVATSIVADAHLATTGVNDVPFGLFITGVQGAPLSIVPVGAMPQLISPTSPTVIEVQVIGGSQNVLAGSPTLVYRSGPAAQFINITLNPVSGNTYSASFPLPACGDTPQFFFSAAGDGGATVTLPAGAPQNFFSAAVGDPILRLSDDFEIDIGWSAADPSDTAVTGRWTRNAPQGTEAQPAADNSPNGSVCFVTDYRAGSQVSDYDVDGGKTTLTSPAFDASNLNEAKVSYWRWYSNGVGPINPNTNVFTVEISNNDGFSWVPVSTTGPSGPHTEPGWFQHSFRIADIVAPTAAMRIRFVASDLTDSIVEAAIDDFVVSGVECPQACYANCDSSTVAPVLNANDFQCFLTSFAAGDPYANCDGSTQEPVLTGNDFQCFLTQFVIGCP
jgi:serine protease AprX